MVGDRPKISRGRGRPKGSRTRKNLVAAARAELAKSALAVDFAASFDSLEIMERVMGHFYLRALIEEKMEAADWKAVDTLMMQALTAAEKVARYRHAQLSAVRLAGEIKTGPADGATLDELIAKIKTQLVKLGPIIDLEFAREPEGSRTERGIEHGRRLRGLSRAGRCGRLAPRRCGI
jgi:hypothetical protein